jgi:hypothetical protein
MGGLRTALDSLLGIEGGIMDEVKFRLRPAMHLTKRKDV